MTEWDQCGSLEGAVSATFSHKQWLPASFPVSTLQAFYIIHMQKKAAEWKTESEPSVEPRYSKKCPVSLAVLLFLRQAGVLQLHISRVWRLLPQKFTVFDFLNVLKAGQHHHGNQQPLLAPGDTTALSVSYIAVSLVYTSLVPLVLFILPHSPTCTPWLGFFHNSSCVASAQVH